MTNSRKTVLIPITFLLLGALIISSCCTKKNIIPSSNASTLLQVCPDEWIQNKMPGPASQEAKEYFILEGKRRELKEFDLSWIKKNCTTKPQIVQ